MVVIGRIDVDESEDAATQSDTPAAADAPTDAAQSETPTPAAADAPRKAETPAATDAPTCRRADGAMRPPLLRSRPMQPDAHVHGVGVISSSDPVIDAVSRVARHNDTVVREARIAQARLERKRQQKAFTQTVKPCATWKQKIWRYKAPRDVRLKIAMIREKDRRKSAMMEAKALRQKSGWIHSAFDSSISSQYMHEEFSRLGA